MLISLDSKIVDAAVWPLDHDLHIATIKISMNHTKDYFKCVEQIKPKILKLGFIKNVNISLV